MKSGSVWGRRHFVAAAALCLSLLGTSMGAAETGGPLGRTTRAIGPAVAAGSPSAPTLADGRGLCVDQRTMSTENLRVVCYPFPTENINQKDGFFSTTEHNRSGSGENRTKSASSYLPPPLLLLPPPSPHPICSSVARGDEPDEPCLAVTLDRILIYSFGLNGSAPLRCYGRRQSSASTVPDDKSPSTEAPFDIQKNGNLETESNRRQNETDESASEIGNQTELLDEKQRRTVEMKYNLDGENGFRWEADQGGNEKYSLDGFVVVASLETEGHRLKVLDLSGVGLRRFSEDFFANLGALEAVNLSCNCLDAFPVRLTNRVSVLDLSENRIMDINFRKFDAETPTLEEEEEEEEEENPVLLTTLNISANKIRRLSRNRSILRRLGHLEMFVASGNIIGSIETGVFTCRLNRLTTVDLSRNRLKTLLNRTFEDLYELKTLNLSYNRIEYIEPQAFYSSPRKSGKCRPNPEFRLFFEEKEGNPEDRIDDLTDGCLGGRWPLLRTVDLSHNSLRSIGSSVSLSPLCGVRELLLGHNLIGHLPRYVIEQLQYLEVIDLRHNSIAWLDVGTFTNQNLRSVDLSFNALRKIISMTFLYLPSVSTIDLSYNSIGYIYRYAIYRICKDDNRTIDISLRGNRLRSDGVWNVLTLFEDQRGGSECSVRADLRGNRVAEIIGRAARESVGKQRAADWGDRSAVWSNVKLDLRDNPLRCDCELAEELEIVSQFHVTGSGNNRSIVDPDALKCGEPEALRGVPVSDFVGSSVCPFETAPTAVTICGYSAGDLRGQVYANCSHRGLKEIPAEVLRMVPRMKNFSSTALDLSYNELETIKINVTLPRVVYLDLSHNLLRELDEDTVERRFPGVEQLLLHDNRLEGIPLPVLGLRRLTNLTVWGNPLQCSCDQNWIETLFQSEEVFSTMIHRWEDLLCDNGQPLARVNLTGCEDNSKRNPEGSSRQQLRVVVFLLSVMLTMLLATSLCLFRLCARLSSLHVNQLSVAGKVRAVRHDLFVVYCDSDAEWVAGPLLDVIWDRFPRYEVVCLRQHQHQQQEQFPGEDGSRRGLRRRSTVAATEYLARNIDSNQATLVVLSKTFLSDVWTLEFFRTAILEKLQVAHHQFIFVILGAIDLERHDAELYECIHRENWILKADDDRFAERLVSCLPRPLNGTADEGGAREREFYFDVYDESPIHQSTQKY